MEGLEPHCCSIAIVGGGCSGALIAVQLLRNGFQRRVTIIEPRARLGLGLAYSTPFDQHLLNVPAGDMTALPDRPSHFLDWLRTRHHRHARADSFAPRRLYGEYLNGLLQEATANGADSRFSHIRAEAVGFGPDGKGARIALSNGSEIRAERVVLAVGNPTSSNVYCSARKGFEDSWHLSPWTDDALRVRFAGERILLWGTGLTAVDAAIALQSQEMNCRVYMVSRGGILPQVHKHRVPAGAPFCFRSRAGLGPRLREFRERIEAARSADLCWRTVIDSLRPISNSLWQTLPQKPTQIPAPFEAVLGGASTSDGSGNSRPTERAWRKRRASGRRGKISEDIPQRRRHSGKDQAELRGGAHAGGGPYHQLYRRKRELCRKSPPPDPFPDRERSRAGERPGSGLQHRRVRRVAEPGNDSVVSVLYARTAPRGPVIGNNRGTGNTSPGRKSRGSPGRAEGLNRSVTALMC